MYFFSVIVGLLFTIVVPIYIAAYYLLNKRLQKKCVYLQTNNSKCFANIISVINEVDYYKQLPKHDGILNIVGRYMLSVNSENAAVSIFGTQIQNLIGFLLNGTNAVTYIVVAVLFVFNHISLSEYVLISMIASKVFPAVGGIVNANLNVRDLEAANTFVGELNGLSEKSGNTVVEDIKDIEFDIPVLGFNEKELIKNVSLKIKRGEKVFISGQSGCGKSTLIKSLLKFIEVDSIYVNSVDIRKYENESYRQKFAFISQNIPIIHGSLEENILLGEGGDVESLCGKRFMRKFFDTAEGMRAEIYDNGANLSGGDKQKIALARLYMRNAQVIVLDESLNAIDADAKEDILSTLFEDFADATIIMISHELELSERFGTHYEVRDKKITKIGG